MELNKQFVRMAEELTDVRCKMADTKSDMYKFVDDKFSCEEDDGSDNASRTCKQGHPSPFIGILRLFAPFWVNNRG